MGRRVKTGDALDEEVDVLLRTANALPRMSGGVNGAPLQRGGEAVGVEVVSRALRDAFAEADRLGARTAATPALATGYGPLSIADFARALAGAMDVAPPELRVVLRKEDDAALVRGLLSSRRP